MGEPANLPNFSKLCKLIASETNEILSKNETEDRFLGKLHHKHIKVQ